MNEVKRIYKENNIESTRGFFDCSCELLWEWFHFTDCVFYGFSKDLKLLSAANNMYIQRERFLLTCVKRNVIFFRTRLLHIERKHVDFHMLRDIHTCK